MVKLKGMTVISHAYSGGIRFGSVKLYHRAFDNFLIGILYTYHGTSFDTLSQGRKAILDTNKDYCSFFLRLKPLQTADLQTWVISMQNVHTGRQQIFSNLDGLIQFLQTEFGDAPVQTDTSEPGTQDAQGFPT